MSLTVTHLNNMAEDLRWEGFGYLGERLNATEERRENADRIVLETANRLNLTHEELFTWANSKNGRWFMDTVTSETRTVEDVEFPSLLPN